VADRTNEDADLALVQELIGGPAGFSFERIASSSDERRPDFQMVSFRGLVGYCEVKSPRDDWLDEQLEQAPGGTIVGGARSDPVFNRIKRHIIKAVTQFDVVNADRSLPNVLVFVNHDDASSYRDLHETLTGQIKAASGKLYELLPPHILDAKLKAARERVDLFIWIDDNRKHRAIRGWLWSDVSPEHTAALRTLLINILPSSGK
jgi:hypothetical protein